MDFKKQTSRRRLLVLMDAVSIIVSLLMAWFTHSVLRNHFAVFKNPPPVDQYLLIGVLTMPLMLSLVVMLGLHRQFEHRFLFWKVLGNQVKLHLASLIGIALIIFLTQVPLNRSVVGIFLVITFVSMSGSRLMVNSWRRRAHATGQGRTHLLIVGSDPKLVEMVVDSARAEDLTPEFVGIVDSGCDLLATNVAFVPVLGRLECLTRVLHEETVDEVVLATRGRDAAAVCRRTVGVRRPRHVDAPSRATGVSRRSPPQARAAVRAAICHAGTYRAKCGGIGDQACDRRVRLRARLAAAVTGDAGHRRTYCRHDGPSGSSSARSVSAITAAASGCISSARW